MEDFLNRTLNSSENNNKNLKMELQQIKKLQYSKDNNYQNQEATYRMRKSLPNSH
jgi:hypothetical protein